MNSAEPGIVIFEVAIGGWPLGYKVTMDTDGTLAYIKEENGKEPTEIRVTPSARDWSRFWHACQKVGIKDWKSSYEPEYPVCDGTGWEFNIQTPELTYKGEGDNEFPAGFDSFLAAIRRLLGGLEFE
jgi:hypothetical protein